MYIRICVYVYCNMMYICIYIGCLRTRLIVRFPIYLHCAWWLRYKNLLFWGEDAHDIDGLLSSHVLVALCLKARIRYTIWWTFFSSFCFNLSITKILNTFFVLFLWSTLAIFGAIFVAIFGVSSASRDSFFFVFNLKVSFAIKWHPPTFECGNIRDCWR